MAVGYDGFSFFPFIGFMAHRDFTVDFKPFYEAVNAHADVEAAESHVGIYLAVKIDVGVNHGADGADDPHERFLMKLKPEIDKAQYQTCGLNDSPEIHGGKLAGYICPDI
jgi:hypothetical protein